MVDSLLRGHTKYYRKKVGGERDFLRRLAAEHQSPDALYVGCSDSRVIPEMLTQSSPGDLFVIRNVANIVPTFENADASVGAALEYAVGHLKVPHIIVCGHYGCGGVKAAVDGLEHVHGMPSLHEWLTPTETTARVVRNTLPADASAEQIWRKAVEANVLEQLEHLATYAVVAKALENDEVELHGWVYDLFSLGLYIYDDETDRFALANDLLKPQE